MKMILFFTLIFFSPRFELHAQTTTTQEKETEVKKTKKSVKKKKKTKKKESKKNLKKKSKKKVVKKKVVAKKTEPKKVVKKSSYIDDTQEFISSMWVNLNYNLDSYFSDQEYNKSENKSRILAYYEVFKKESSPMKKLFDIKIRVHFPKLSKRLSITIEKERDEILESRINEAQKNQATNQNQYNASVDYSFENIPFFETKLRTGFRFTLPLDPFAKLKFNKSFTSKYINIHFEQMFMYYRQDYFQEYTSLSFSKQLSDNWSISQSNSVSWSDSDDDWYARNTLNLNQRVNDKIGINYSVGANASFDPTYYYTSYDASIGYHQLLYKDWFFGNLSVGSEFSRSNDWKMTNFIVVRTEVLFH